MGTGLWEGWMKMPTNETQEARRRYSFETLIAALIGGFYVGAFLMAYILKWALAQNGGCLN